MSNTDLKSQVDKDANHSLGETHGMLKMESEKDHVDVVILEDRQP